MSQEKTDTRKNMATNAPDGGKLQVVQVLSVGRGGEKEEGGGRKGNLKDVGQAERLKQGRRKNLG